MSESGVVASLRSSIASTELRIRGSVGGRKSGPRQRDETAQPFEYDGSAERGISLLSMLSSKQNPELLMQL